MEASTTGAERTQYLKVKIVLELPDSSLQPSVQATMPRVMDAFQTYLRELRPRPVLRTTLEATMVAFEEVFFGRHELSRERFEACWSRLDEFHRHVRSTVRAEATSPVAVAELVYDDGVDLEPVE